MSTGGGSVTPEPSVGPASSACLEELPIRGVAAVHRAAAFALGPGEELRIEAEAHHNDLVTQVDYGVEGRIAGHLEATGAPIHGREAHRIKDFETYRRRAWVLGPIDGTLSYVATHRDWAISLALVDDDVPMLAILADPVADRLYTAIRGRSAWVQPLLAGSAGTDDAAPQTLERLEDLPLGEGMLIAYYRLAQDVGIDQAIEASCGMRYYGAAALEMAEVIAGDTVAYTQSRLQPWGVATGALLCAKTGTVLTRMDGAPFNIHRAGSLLMDTPTAHAEVLGHLRAVGAWGSLWRARNPPSCGQGLYLEIEDSRVRLRDLPYDRAVVQPDERCI